MSVYDDPEFSKWRDLSDFFATKGMLATAIPMIIASFFTGSTAGLVVWAILGTAFLANIFSALWSIHMWGKASDRYFEAEFERIDREHEQRMREIRGWNAN